MKTAALTVQTSRRDEKRERGVYKNRERERTDEGVFPRTC